MLVEAAGCTHRSTTVDHIIPVGVRPDLALVRTNCRGACHSCDSLRRNTPITQLAPLREFAGPLCTRTDEFRW